MVANPVDHHANKHGEGLESLEHARGGEQFGHDEGDDSIIVTLACDDVKCSGGQDKTWDCKHWPESLIRTQAPA